MLVYPVQIERRSPDTLLIVWSDRQRREYPVRQLRDACPCATCREQRSAPAQAPNPLAILSPAETRPLAITEMSPVGNYAYSIRFTDGHDTGIYTLEFLRQLGHEVEV